MMYSSLDRPPLDASALIAALVGPGRLWTNVVVTESTASTNADVAVAAGQGAPEGTVHTTEIQTAGRGRLDRSWEAPAGSGIAVSVLLRPTRVPAGRWVWLPLLVGIAVDATVNGFEVKSGLKWPNDVIVGDRKIAGILLERVETQAGPAAVVGVGLNVSLRKDELPVDTATSLAIEGASEIDRTIVLRSFLRNLESLYGSWLDSEGDPDAGIRDSYLRRCTTIGKNVRVSLPDGSVLEGVATGIDDFGRLLVGNKALSAGDVTHVRSIP